MNTSRTIEQLESTPWPEPSADATQLIRRCRSLRRVPLAQLGLGDLRVLIGQDIALKYLMPLAITALKSNPMLEAEYYPGDLLAAAMSVERSFWVANPEGLAQLAQLAQHAQALITTTRNPQGSGKLPKTSRAFRPEVLPNPSLERTSKGRPRSTALLLSVPRGLPLGSAQLKR